MWITNSTTSTFLELYILILHFLPAEDRHYMERVILQLLKIVLERISSRIKNSMLGWVFSSSSQVTLFVSHTISLKTIIQIGLLRRSEQWNWNSMEFQKNWDFIPVSGSQESAGFTSFAKWLLCENHWPLNLCYFRYNESCVVFIYYILVIML